MDLRFDSEQHVYLVDGRPVPSVTGVLRACGLTTQFEFRDKIHAFRGTCVHQGSAIVIAGGTPVLAPLQHPHDKRADYVQVHSEIPGYLEAMRSAKDAIGFQGAIYECPFVDIERGYAGTFDFGAYAKGHQLWDIKSGTYPVMTIVQLCAYEDLIRRGQPVNPDHPGLPWLLDLVKSVAPMERCGLRLEKTGKFTAYYECPKGRSYQDAIWPAAWRSALFLFQVIPAADREFAYQDSLGYVHKGSRLLDMKWVANWVKQNLTGHQYDVAMRAGSNLYNIREAYNLL